LKQGFLVSVEKIGEWWDYAVSLAIGMKITLIHLFRPNFTFYYPEQEREIPDYFRGKHVLDFDENGEHLCISCKACERICPDRLILISFVKNPETKKLELTGFLLDNSRCSFCGLCEDVCPTGAIRHTDEFAYSVEDRGELILDLLKEYRERSAPLREKRLRERQMGHQSASISVGATEIHQASVEAQK
jgi:NADH-quinone oxidoreductase subunit I